MNEQLGIGQTTTNGIAIGQIWDRRENLADVRWNHVEVVEIDESGMAKIKPLGYRFDAPMQWMSPQILRARYTLREE